jgi:hypothetical protein
MTTKSIELIRKSWPNFRSIHSLFDSIKLATQPFALLSVRFSDPSLLKAQQFAVMPTKLDLRSPAEKGWDAFQNRNENDQCGKKRHENTAKKTRQPVW